MKKDRSQKKGEAEEEVNIDAEDVEFYNDEAQNRFGSVSDDAPTAEAEDLIRDLKKRLKESEREKLENLTGWQRAKADYINLKKRGSEANERNERQAREAVVLSFLPIIDSFDAAMKGDSWDSANENWRSGVLSIYKQFISVLEANGVEEIGNEGEPFDPYIHTSVSMVSTDDESKDHLVAEVLQKGYRFTSGEIIRSPKVTVFEKEP